MKQSLQSKQKLALRLSGYAASAGAILAIGSSANGQVVYSGLQNIEVSLPETYLEIDIDGDMVNDFGFYGYGYLYSYSYGPYFIRYGIGVGVLMNARTDGYLNSWITKSSTVTMESSYSTYYYHTKVVDGLELGEIIDSLRDQWSNTTYISWPGVLGISYYASYYGPYGTAKIQWDGGEFLGEEKFIGARFYIGSEQHYGWIRLSMGDQVEPITIIDWAYESTAEERILAGDGLGLDLPPHLLIAGGGGATTEPTRTLTVVASEEVTGLESGDFNVTNGSSDNFTEVTAGWEYTIDITAAAEGKVTVEIPAGAVTDLTANENMASSTSWNYDLTPPYPVFPYPPDYTNYNYTWIYMEFSEVTEGLEMSDFNVTNGTINYLYEYYPGVEYELEIFSSNEGEVTLEIVAGAVHDLAGNPSEAASIGWIFDATPPEVTLDAGVTSTTNAVNTVDVTFSEFIQYLDQWTFLVTNGTATDLETITPNMHYTLEVTADIAGIVIVELPEYSVWDVAYNGNIAATTGWLYEPVSIIPSVEDRVSLYPNPVDGNLHIELEEEAMIRISNLNGTVLFQQDHVLSEIIDMSGFTPGIYIVQIENTNKITQHRLIVE